MPDVAREIADRRADYAWMRKRLAGPPDAVHLMGLGGVGMAGLAVHLAARGFRVSGCDTAPEYLGPWLARRGILLQRGHDPTHLADELNWLVRSPAVSDQEPEAQAARARGLPIVSRGVVLPALLADQRGIAVGGTHGKTTTSAMMAHALRGCGVDASYCIGGEPPTLEGVAAVGRGDAMVVEADESDGTLALYEAEYAVITNVEMDHVDFFTSEADLDLCFGAFAAQARRAVVYHGDDAGARRAVRRAGTRALAYGFGAGPGWRAHQVSTVPRAVSAQIQFEGREQGPLQLNVPGATNLLNALAVVATLVDRGLPFPAVAEALSTFRSVRRRFEVVAQGGGLTVISDYAHHPTEIAACMQQVRGWGAGRVLVVFQAHRYTRTAALGPAFPPAFAGATEVILTPIYAASERPVPGGGLNALAEHFRRHGQIPVTPAQSLLEAWELIRQKWRPGDVLLVAGAGDVEKIAQWAAESVRATSQ